MGVGALGEGCVPHAVPARVGLVGHGVGRRAAPVGDLAAYYLEFRDLDSKYGVSEQVLADFAIRIRDDDDMQTVS